MNEEQLSKVLAFLNLHHPTGGDGAWSKEFIYEVFRGRHIGHNNRELVVSALFSDRVVKIHHSTFEHPRYVTLKRLGNNESLSR